MNRSTAILLKGFTALILGLFSFKGTAQCFIQISSKFDQVVAINTDSTLWTWGATFGPLSGHRTPFLIDSSKHWKQVATGSGNAFALKSDGTLWAWGSNTYGVHGDGTSSRKWAPTRVTNDSSWVKIASGEFFTVALKSNGTVWAWGRNTEGQLGLGTNRNGRFTPAQVGTDSNFIDISAGRYSTLLKKADNSLWHFGACFNSSDVSQIRQVGSSTDWESMSGGNFTNYAIKQNGSLWKFVTSSGSPSGLAQVGSASDWQKLDNSQTSSLDNHALFIKTNGTLWAIGRNRFGQLGTGNLNLSNTPIQVGTDTDWNEVVAGNITSFALKNDASFWAWGRNNHAQFGNGQAKSNLQAVHSTVSWAALSSIQGFSGAHAVALKTNGTLWSWGHNDRGQLGIANQVHQTLPIQIGSDTDWRSFSIGSDFSLAIKNNGTLWSWGLNNWGQMGIGNTVLPYLLSPNQIGTSSDWLKVSAGNGHILALKEDSTLWAWGLNNNGQLGNGASGVGLTQSSPLQIGTDTNWAFIVASGGHSIALKADSTLWTWGANNSGQLGRTGNTSVPMLVDSTRKFIAISGGGNQTLVLDTDSLLWGCGQNNNCQLGDGTLNDKATLIKIDSSNKWIKISTGQDHSLGLRLDGSLWGWGLNSRGQIGDSATYSTPYRVSVPTLISSDSWVEIAGGIHSSFAIQANGTLYSMGDAYIPSSPFNYPVLGYAQTSPLFIDSCKVCTPTRSQLSQSICKGGSYLFGGKTLTVPGTYSDTLSNAQTCDSIITLQLSITNIDTSLTINGLSAISNEPGASYQWLDCNNAYSVIPTETAQSFTPTSSGSYAVEVSKNACIDTSNCQSFTVVGLLENRSIQSTSLFPSPTSGEFHILFSSVQNSKVSIFNIQGKQVDTRLVSGKKMERFSLEALDSGIYIVKIENGQESTTLKVVKQ